MIARRAATAVVWTALSCGGASFAGADGTAQARISLDAREADVRDLAGALLQVAGLQGVFDPDVSCRLTLKVHEIDWLPALQATLNACGLGYEEEGTVVRIAPRERLRAELAERRRLNEERQQSRAGRVTLFRLSYARAREVAPLLKKLLPPRAEIAYDDRTNTLILVD